MKNQVLKLPFLFGVGGTVYYIMEILWRGYSHWSMFVLSGICFVIIGLLDKAWKKGHSCITLMALSSVIITSLEFITGLIVNKWLGLAVWDYSEQPFNLMGQICLLFSVLWLFLSYFALLLDNCLRFLFFHEKPLHLGIFTHHRTHPKHK